MNAKNIEKFIGLDFLSHSSIRKYLNAPPFYTWYLSTMFVVLVFLKLLCLMTVLLKV